MQITRNSVETATAPSDWFTGTVYIDAAATPSEGHACRRAASTSPPAPGPPGTPIPNGQTIYVTEGVRASALLTRRA